MFTLRDLEGSTKLGPFLSYSLILNVHGRNTAFLGYTHTIFFDVSRWKIENQIETWGNLERTTYCQSLPTHIW